MVNKTILMRKISKITSLSQREASDCIEAVFNTLVDELSNGGKVELRGFGVFSVKNFAAKKISFSNIQFGVLPEHGKVIFKPCQKLKESVWNLKGKPVSTLVQQPVN